MNNINFKVQYVMLAIILALQTGTIAYLINTSDQKQVILTEQHIKYAPHDTQITTVTEYTSINK